MVDYHIEEVQHFKVAIYGYHDIRFKMDELEKQDFLGEAQFKLADVTTTGTVLTRQLGGSK